MNPILKDITDNDDRGVLFDAQVSPFRRRDDQSPDGDSLVHNYDHYAVGVANANLFLNTFPVPEPSSTLLLGLGSLGLIARRKRT